MDQRAAYTDVENLEVMREARNYNQHLLDMVREQALRCYGRMIYFGAGARTSALPLALGFDITAVAPEDFLRSRLQDSRLKVASDVAELNDQSFDYVYTLNVLEHIQDDVTALRHLHAKLVANGLLLIYVSAFLFLYASMGAKMGHVRHTRSTPMAAVGRTGFAVEQVGYVDSIGFLAALLFKLVNSGSGTVSRFALKAYDRCVFLFSLLLDVLVRRWFGKNLLLIARKRGADEARHASVLLGTPDA